MMGRRLRREFNEYPLHFITTTCYKWYWLFSELKYFEILRDSMMFCLEKYNASLTSYVFMPNHIHLIVYFRSNLSSSDFMRDFKKFTSFAVRTQIEKDGKIILLESLRYKKGKQVFKVWKDRFDDFSLFRSKTILTKINYIHDNPVRKKFVISQEDYKYSSAGFYVNRDSGFLKVEHIFDVIGWGNQYENGIIWK